MAVLSNTHASIIDRVRREYGRLTQELQEILGTKLQEWFRELASEYDFSFLQIWPGVLGPTLFPFDPTTPVFVDLDTDETANPTGSCWIDVGYLHTTEDQLQYFFAIPDDLEDPTGTTWRRCAVSKVAFIQKVDVNGARTNYYLTMLDYEQFWACADYSSSGEPRYATLVTRNGRSYLQVAPKPDAGPYIYQVGFALADFPPMTDPGASNLLYQNYPQVAVAAGCLMAARFHDDDAGIGRFSSVLNGGVDQDGRRIPGLLDAMKRDTAKQHQGRSDTAKTYLHPPPDRRRRGDYWRSAPLFGGQ